MQRFRIRPVLILPFVVSLAACLTGVIDRKTGIKVDPRNPNRVALDVYTYHH